GRAARRTHDGASHPSRLLEPARALPRDGELARRTAWASRVGSPRSRRGTLRRLDRQATLATLAEEALASGPEHALARAFPGRGDAPRDAGAGRGRGGAHPRCAPEGHRRR